MIRQFNIHINNGSIMNILILLITALALAATGCNTTESPTQPQRSALAKQPFAYPTDTYHGIPWGGTLPNGNPSNPQAQDIQDAPFSFEVTDGCHGGTITITGTLHFINGEPDGAHTITVEGNYSVVSSEFSSSTAPTYFLGINLWVTDEEVSCTGQLVTVYLYTTTAPNGDITVTTGTPTWSNN